MTTPSENASTSTIPSASAKNRGPAAAFSRNAAAGLVRLFVSSLVGLVLPAYLTRHLPVKTFSAWVLILQLSAYVSYLDFGVQTGVAKYVAEYEAKADREGAARCASAGFAILLVAGLLGVLLTLILAWRVPQLFRDMPAFLYRDVRISVVLIGMSLSFGLASSAFSGIFLGLQRYAVPMAIAVINRILFMTVVCSAAFLRSGLAAMGTAAAAVNVLTALLQIAAWRKLAHTIRVSLFWVDRNTLKQMLGYCLVLAVWSASMLCISGLDVAIVAHYAFSETGFYSIATAPVNLIIAVLSATLVPLIPAASALSAQRTAVDMGRILSRVTRYTTLLLLLSGLPLLVGGYAVLRLWVGSVYALHSVRYLRILVLANILRSLCAPYATLVVATGKQKVATAAAVSEGLVNLTVSLYLASHMGAIGVALGTLLGALVSVSMHFVLSMHYTYKTLEISRTHLLLRGILRPSVIAVPSALLVPLWWSSAVASLNLQIWLTWALSTVLLLWFGSLTVEERNHVRTLVRGQIKLLVASN
jgi:O-antigen/teichoic acid export membrane protein